MVVKVERVGNHDTPLPRTTPCFIAHAANPVRLREVVPGPSWKLEERDEEMKEDASRFGCCVQILGRNDNVGWIAKLARTTFRTSPRPPVSTTTSVINANRSSSCSLFRLIVTSCLVLRRNSTGWKFPFYRLYRMEITFLSSDR